MWLLFDRCKQDSQSHTSRSSSSCILKSAQVSCLISYGAYYLTCFAPSSHHSQTGMNQTKHFYCPFCVRALCTSQGVSSHIQQTGCNKRPGLVALSSYSLASGSSTPLLSDSSTRDNDLQPHNEFSVQPPTEPEPHSHIHRYPMCHSLYLIQKLLVFWDLGRLH